MLLLVLLGCEPDPDCTLVDMDCDGAVCMLCTTAVDDGWVQCTDGWEIPWNRPTGATVDANDIAFDQAMLAFELHCLGLDGST